MDYYFRLYLRTRICLPNEIIEIIEKELASTEIEVYSHPWTRDFIYCNFCCEFITDCSDSTHLYYCDVYKRKRLPYKLLSAKKRKTAQLQLCSTHYR